jgi:hypothetical protein
MHSIVFCLSCPQNLFSSSLQHLLLPVHAAIYPPTMFVFVKRLDLLFDRSIVQATICYGPNGVPYGPDIIPCNAALVIETGGKQASMCCSMGGCAKSANDTCHSTGLCQNDDRFFRDFCTDSTFQSPNCLNICIDSNVRTIQEAFVEIESLIQSRITAL